MPRRRRWAKGDSSPNARNACARARESAEGSITMEPLPFIVTEEPSAPFPSAVDGGVGGGVGGQGRIRQGRIRRHGGVDGRRIRSRSVGRGGIRANGLWGGSCRRRALRVGDRRGRFALGAAGRDGRARLFGVVAVVAARFRVGALAHEGIVNGSAYAFGGRGSASGRIGRGRDARGSRGRTGRERGRLRSRARSPLVLPVGLAVTVALVAVTAVTAVAGHCEACREGRKARDVGVAAGRCVVRCTARREALQAGVRVGTKELRVALGALEAGDHAGSGIGRIRACVSEEDECGQAKNGANRDHEVPPVCRFTFPHRVVSLASTDRSRVRNDFRSSWDLLRKGGLQRVRRRPHLALVPPSRFASRAFRQKENSRPLKGRRTIGQGDGQVHA